MHDIVQLQAMEWQVVLWSGEVSDDEQAAFDRWLSSSPDHKAAWQSVQTFNQAFSQVPSPLAGQVLRKPQTNLSRRKALASLLLVAGGAGLAYRGPSTELWQAAWADVSTRTGERRSLILDDGTELVLNTNTAVDVRFDPFTRLLHLHHGEVMVRTARDTKSPSRPLIIRTSEGWVRPIGTYFSVQQIPEAQYPVKVQVFEGQVALSPNRHSEVKIAAGEQLAFSQSSVAVVESVDASAASWVNGQLIMERQPLGQVVKELARYRRGVVRCDPAIQHLIVSGVYPLDDTDAALASLANGLSIKLQHYTAWWVSLSPQ